jgi:asparagine synthase (glutamine-hydrolysing)
MSNHDGRLWISFNGEVYNYLELRQELQEYPFRSKTDTEVVLAAYERWGEQCLDKLIGMFSFLIWDMKAQSLLAVRDRFGVKPLHCYLRPDYTLFLSSEIKALQAAGAPRELDPVSWSSYLAYGLQDRPGGTFWSGVTAVPPGHFLQWDDRGIKLVRWYDVADRIGPGWDDRPIQETQDEYQALLEDSIRLRFRSDVPVGLNLSGGLDSSVLVGAVGRVRGQDSPVKSFTFVTGDSRYDELPWVQEMLEHTQFPLVKCPLFSHEVPDLARSVQRHQDEPFGGLPTLAYARLFEYARRENVTVLLDGQGMDEQWAGYDYYQKALNGDRTEHIPLVQGATDRALRPDCLQPDFCATAQLPENLRPFSDRLRNLQYRDIVQTKMPRALRYNDRVSMRSSTELREPFLDHRLFELALRQSTSRKIRNGTSKWLLRQIASKRLPGRLVEAPKRPVQTPQREWLRGPLRSWANDCIETAIHSYGGSWLEPASVRRAWKMYCDGISDNSFFVWQWIGLGMIHDLKGDV